MTPSTITDDDVALSPLKVRALRVGVPTATRLPLLYGAVRADRKALAFTWVSNVISHAKDCVWCDCNSPLGGSRLVSIFISLPNPAITSTASSCSPSWQLFLSACFIPTRHDNNYIQHMGKKYKLRSTKRQALTLHIQLDRAHQKK